MVWGCFEGKGVLESAPAAATEWVKMLVRNNEIPGITGTYGDPTTDVDDEHPTDQIASITLNQTMHLVPPTLDVGQHGRDMIVMKG